jgi:hypothetical protein
VASRAEAPEIPTIVGKVMQTAGDMYMSTKADVSVQLDIVDHGATVQSLVCSGTASNVAWTASAEEFRKVFEEAMTEFANQCGPRLTGALTGGGSS